MGGAVSISSPTSPDALEIKNIFEDKQRFNALFKEMSSFGQSEGRIDLNNNISMSELILFVEKGGNPLISRVCTAEPLVLKEAFDFAYIGKKNHDHELSRKEFRTLLPTLILFTHFWKIFEVADSSIDDRRIFKHEFISAKRCIESIEGVSVAPITDEAWLSEFEIIDKNKNGFLSFHEFCKYAVKKIIDPKFYMEGIHAEADDIEMTPEMDENAASQGSSHEETSAVCTPADSCDGNSLSNSSDGPIQEPINEA